MIWATNSRATVAGMRTQNIDGVQAGATGYLRWENGHYTVIDSSFDEFRSPSQSFNEIIQNGAHLVYVNVRRPDGGPGFISYGDDSTYIVVERGEVRFAANNAGMLRLPRYADSERPPAGEAGRIVYNEDDENINVDDGSTWILPDGTTT